MSLSFFRALNPLSEQSGINYSLAFGLPCQGKEMLDTTVAEKIKKAYNSDLDFMSGLMATYDILAGEHYDLNIKGRTHCNGGSKGVLDFLILPLISRKLIADFYENMAAKADKDINCADVFTGVLSGSLVFSVALSIEMARIMTAVMLTIALAPVVGLVHATRACLATNNDVSRTNERNADERNADERISFA